MTRINACMSWHVTVIDSLYIIMLLTRPVMCTDADRYIIILRGVLHIPCIITVTGNIICFIFISPSVL